jgi:Zn-dependent protease/CBS domain-containing protein
VTPLVGAAHRKELTGLEAGGPAAFRHTIPLGKVLGISINLDYSWFLVFGLLTWVLAAAYYPAEFKNWSVTEYWIMGAVTALALFASVLLHELGHSVVAKRFGIRVPRITLFVFGGVSEISTEPPSAGVEFWIAIAGPIVSFLLALLFWELRPAVATVPPLLALTQYLAILNFVLGLFNLVPGFPLDGGRVFRSLVWGATRNFRRASAIATTTGQFFGFGFIFIGVWMALNGSFLNGLWIAFIGWFLESAASSQGQMQAVRERLGGHKVAEAMSRTFPRASGHATLQELVDKHVLAEGSRCFVITAEDGSAGLVTLSIIKDIPRSDWPRTEASQVMIPLNKASSIEPSAELWTALERMGRDGVNQLPVLKGNDHNEIVGMLSRDDLVHYLRILQVFAE